MLLQTTVLRLPQSLSFKDGKNRFREQDGQGWALSSQSPDPRSGYTKNKAGFCDPIPFRGALGIKGLDPGALWDSTQAVSTWDVLALWPRLGVLELWLLAVSRGFALWPVWGSLQLWGRRACCESGASVGGTRDRDSPQRRRAPMTHSLAS